MQLHMCNLMGWRISQPLKKVSRIINLEMVGSSVTVAKVTLSLM